MADRAHEWFELWGCYDEEGEPCIKVGASEITGAGLDDSQFRLLCTLRFLAVTQAGALDELSVEELARLRGDAPTAVRKQLDYLRGLGLLEPFASIPWIAGRPEGLVYFIQSVDGGPIKIGTSVDPRKRLREIQTSHPSRLQIVGLIEGGIARERELHQTFAHLRLEGEWFALGPELIDFIYKINKDHHGNE